MPDPTPDSLRLRALARGLVDALVETLPPAAALLTGSAAEGIADQHSDLDLLLYYGALPERAAFVEVMAGAGARLRSAMLDGADFFSDSYDLVGFEVQTGATRLAHVERTLDRVLAGGHPGEPSTKVCIGILHGLALHGEGLIGGWRARVAEFPDGLREKAVAAGLRVFPSWRYVSMFAARDAALFERQMLVEGGLNLVMAWSALNRVYFTPFQFKRQRAHLDGLARVPAAAADRLDRLSDAEPASAAAELRSLLADTLELVEAEMPAFDTAPARSLLG